MDNLVDNHRSAFILAVAVAWYRYARESHAELIQSLYSHRLALASSASWANIIDDSCISADWVSVYRMVDRTVSYTGFLHESDYRFKGLRVLCSVTVELNIADVACVSKIMLRCLDCDLLKCSDRIVYRNVE